MRFADNYCKCEEVMEPEHVFIYSGHCRYTGDPHSVTVRAKDLERYRQGSFIQDAMPSLSSNDREFLISGTGPGYWDKLMGDLL